ncbi:hypothetical protein RSOLAG22IIIB_13906 [Rhizoctonia solani]|uniref:AC transposase n=1 Tax=Rhizoctonia solani TaxID=456999 RepID=A0A0K6FRX3_9AGAM|nr:hypothetical protein RSOLAG22IIIB_13906 [Rhizoctonia solani]
MSPPCPQCILRVFCTIHHTGPGVLPPSVSPSTEKLVKPAPFIFYQPSWPVTLAKPLVESTREEIHALATKNSSPKTQPPPKHQLDPQPTRDQGAPAKRRRPTNNSTDPLTTPAPALPPTIAATLSASSSLGGGSATQRARHFACEAWYFCKGCNTQAPPVGSNQEQLQAADKDNLEGRVFCLSRRPNPTQFSRLLCLLCWLNNGAWKTWANGDGVTNRLREHLDKHHMDEYCAKCHEEGVVVPALDSELARIADSLPAYTNWRLVEYLAQWVAVDDQAMSVIDRKEFRRVILYASQSPEPLHESDIPHRTKLTAVTSELYQEEMARIKTELAKTLGKVSVTSDLWSDNQLHSFMVVTLHYINSMGDLAEHLYAFRRIRGSHTGANVGRVLYSVLEDAGIANKIGHITLDNASSNDTLMAELETTFNDKRSSFERKLNRIR